MDVMKKGIVTLKNALYVITTVALMGAVGCSWPTAKGVRHRPNDDYKVVGYSTRSLIPRKYKTINVPIFKNRTLERRFEFELTQAVIEMIEARTHMKVVNSAVQADTKLTCVVTDFKRRVLSENVADAVQELQVCLVMSMKWVDRKTGKVIVQYKALNETAEAVPARGESDMTVARKAFKDIAEKIVEKMESDW